MVRSPSYPRLGNLTTITRTLRSLRSLMVPIFAQSVAPSMGHAIISPALTNEDYDEEREMEPRPEPNREVTPTLRLRSPVVHRQRERVMGFEEAPNREGSRRGRNAEGSFADSTGSVTPFVCWIEDYPLLDGLKMPSHIGSYDGKGDPDNFLHLFKGAIRMQKWLMPVACHMFTYTLKDSARIWWNSQKTGSILNYEDLKAKFQSHFSQQNKFTKKHLAVHNIKQRKGQSTRAFVTRYTNDTLQILGLHEDVGNTKSIGHFQSCNKS
ncbi:reverse transcriptase domain-containing protein [Tanacetum coccineum]